MEKFWVVSLFHLQPTPGQWGSIQSLALDTYGAIGVEEYSLDEAEVDALLGERSYSGGDLPLEVLDEVEASMQSTPTTCRFFFEKATAAQDFYEQVRSNNLSEVQIQEEEAADWNAEWKKHYAPIIVSESLAVVPAWQKESEVAAKEKILINPGMGFGTGSHETTFLCLKFFTQLILGRPLSRVLDFGSGSGILGLTALKFYPEAQVDFYDIDPEANKNCYENALINDLQDKSFRLLLPQVRSKLQSDYDLVFANILENILVAEKESLISLTRPGGWLILSGLLKHQAAQIISLYSSDLMLVKEEIKGDWSALLFQKAKA